MQQRKPLGRPFWRLWTAITASSLGDGMFTVALPLLALEFTRSPLAISGVVIAGQVPAIATALPVGALADRLNRRRLIVAIESARFVVLAAFGTAIALHRDGLALIYLTAFLLGGLDMGFDVAANSCLPSMVGRDDLVRANARLMNAELTSENLVGQALGGAALAVTAALPFLADAASFIASAAILNRAIPDNEPVREGTSAWQDLREGLRWFLGHSVLRLLTTVIASLAFCQGIVFALLALYARETLHLSGTGYGLLLAVSSIGTLLGGFAAAPLHKRLGSGMTIVFAGMVAAAAYPFLAVTHSAVVAAGALMAETGVVIIGNVASRSLRQRIVPANMQGRAASANSMMILSCVPLGALVGGLVAGSAGIRPAIMMAAGLQVAALAAAGPRLLTRIRKLESTPTLDLTHTSDEGTPADSPQVSVPVSQ